jgi:hypothetical protein
MSFPVSYDESKLRNIYDQLIRKVIPLISTPANMGLSNESWKPICSSFAWAQRFRFSEPPYFLNIQLILMSRNIDLCRSILSIDPGGPCNLEVSQTCY